MFSYSNIDLTHLGIQIVIVCAAVVILWLFVKSIKLIWKLLIVILIFFVLSFALPVVREWILKLF